jgi:hypothetical protein
MTFTLPNETDEASLREAFMYMTVRTLLIKVSLEAGMSWDEVQRFVEMQDEIWEGLGGMVTDGWSQSD